MMRKVGLVLLGGLWSLLFFWLGLTLTFPRTQAAERVKYEVAQATGDSMLVQLEGIGPWAATGAKATAVELFTVPRRGDPSRVLRADSVAARLQVVPLLSGKVSVGTDARLYDGSLAGSVAQDGDQYVVDLLAKDLDLSLYPFDFESFSTDMSGRLRMRADLTWNTEDVAKSDGLVRLEVADLALGETSIGGFFTLPATTFTEAILSFTIADGKAKVKKGSFVSDLVTVEIDGDINLRSPLGRSTVNLTVDFKLSEELDGMASLVPDLKRARDDEGTYHYRVTGTLDRRRFTPVRQGSASTTPTSRPSRASRRVKDRDEDPRSPSTDPDELEERRRARQERIRERRDRIARGEDEPRPRPSTRRDEDEDFTYDDFDQGEEDLGFDDDMDHDDDVGIGDDDDLPPDDDIIDDFDDMAPGGPELPDDLPGMDDPFDD